MSHSHETHKEAKKKPQMTPKEKKVAKQAKKLAQEAPPLITPPKP